MNGSKLLGVQLLRGITDGFLLAGQTLCGHDHLLQLLDIVFKFDIDHPGTHRYDGGLHSDESDSQGSVPGDIRKHEVALGTGRGTVRRACDNHEGTDDRIAKTVTDSTLHLDVLCEKRSRHRKEKARNE